MKHCTTCQHLYPDPLQACPTDNQPLRAVRELEPGMVIKGKYIILDWIGAGGMAVVYRAKHRLLNEMRAVKVVSPKFAGDEDFIKRFRHEAAIARRLRHENAVWVEDLDELEDGRPFIAMEFLEGDDLRKVIRDQGPLAVNRSLNLGGQVASALSAAHKFGIIHRDIKPDNIFISRDAAGKETAKVLDFGIAKAREGVLQGGYTATKTGIIIGTPDYMSPEQAEGQLGDKLDGRSDIYSLGVVLYEMLTAQLPFESDTPLGMCMHHLQTMPRPPHEARPDLRIPEAVSALLMKALEKRRERRFQSADEILAALRDPQAWARQSGVRAEALAPTRIAKPQAARQVPAVTQAAPAARVTQNLASIARPVAALPDNKKKGGKKTDKNKPWRIVFVALAVAVCVAAGYLLVNQLHVRNAELDRHNALVRQGIVEKLQSSSTLQGRKLAVTFSSGTATLSGAVQSPGDKDAAGNLAREVPGVTDVVNNISVLSKPPVRAPSAPVPANTASSKPGTDAQQDSPPQGARPVSATEDHLPQPPIVSSPPAGGTSGQPTATSANASKANQLVRLGKEKLDDGKYDDAIAIFRKALQLDPNNAAAKIGLKQAGDAHKTEQDVLQQK